MRFEITTPERIVFSDEIDEVVLPTPMGEIGILPHHVPLIALIEPGEVRFKKGGETTYMAVSGGFVEVRPDKVVVLADTAERAEEIDEGRSEEARTRALQIRSQAHAGTVQYAAMSAKIDKELARLKVARHRRRPRSAHPGAH